MYLVLSVFLLVVIVGIVVAATRSAKRGRRYLGTPSLVQEPDPVGDLPYGRFIRVGQLALGWRQRVRLQAQLEWEREEERAAAAREQRVRRTSHPGGPGNN